MVHAAIRFTLSLILCAGSLVATGCATHNLDERPDWAFSVGSELPSIHPKHAAYDSPNYMTAVVEGRGTTVERARTDAEANAKASFARQILTRVDSELKLDTKTHETFKDDSGSISTTDDLRHKVTMTTNNVIAGVEAIDVWNLGWQESEETGKVARVVFAAFVLDKNVAGSQALAVASQIYARLKGIENEQLSAQDALNALKDMIELEVVQIAVRYFGKRPPSVQASGPLKRRFEAIIRTRGLELENANTDGTNEEALALYESAQGLAAGGSAASWNGLILRVKRKLPCLECGRVGTCTLCLASRGEFLACTSCGGSKIVRPQCTACKGTGQAVCTKCNNQRGNRGGGAFGKALGGLLSGNLDLSGTHQPEGSYTLVTCRKTVRCEQCSGMGKVSTPQGPAMCMLCGGDGQTDCSECGGSGQKAVTCTQCNGIGRYGTCITCRGAGQIEQTCNSCNKDGLVWHACTQCNGSGVCHVCRGAKHRR